MLATHLGLVEMGRVRGCLVDSFGNMKKFR